MGRYDPRGSRYAAIVACHSEHAEVYGRVSGRKSLCTGSGLKWLREAGMRCMEVGAVARIGMFLWGGVDDTIQEKNMNIGM